MDKYTNLKITEHVLIILSKENQENQQKFSQMKI
jgi:hypothetical protein